MSQRIPMPFRTHDEFVFDWLESTGGHSTAPIIERRLMAARRSDTVAIVGESAHQEVLLSLLDAYGRWTWASLVAERENVDDSMAVAVMIEGYKVGYLSPLMAGKYGPILAADGRPTECAAMLHGGEWDQPFVTVLLEFSAVYRKGRTHQRH